MGRVWARFINTLVRDVGMTSNSRAILVLGASLLMIAVFGMSTMSGTGWVFPMAAQRAGVNCSAMLYCAAKKFYPKLFTLRESRRVRTSNIRFPFEHGSDRHETWAERVSDDLQFLIF